jgi:hypothetical protein
MKNQKNKFIVAALLLLLAVSGFAAGKERKTSQRGMLESMQSVPCGSKERGVTGVGSVFASVGVAHVNSHEQLCPQYYFRTDEMDYHIRPADMKHAGVLPVGKEAEFKIKKNRLFLRVPGEDKKAHEFVIVAMQPATAENKVEGASYRPADNPPSSQPPNAGSPPPPSAAPNAAAPPSAPANPNPSAPVVQPPPDHPQQQ